MRSCFGSALGSFCFDSRFLKFIKLSAGWFSGKGRGNWWVLNPGGVGPGQGCSEPSSSPCTQGKRVPGCERCVLRARVRAAAIKCPLGASSSDTSGTGAPGVRCCRQGRPGPSTPAEPLDLSRAQSLDLSRARRALRRPWCERGGSWPCGTVHVAGGTCHACAGTRGICLLLWEPRPCCSATLVLQCPSSTHEHPRAGREAGSSKRDSVPARCSAPCTLLPEPAPLPGHACGCGHGSVRCSVQGSN